MNSFALEIVFAAVNILQKLLCNHDDASRQPHDTSDNIVGSMYPTYIKILYERPSLLHHQTVIPKENMAA